jgi:hypothetical protein
MWRGTDVFSRGSRRPCGVLRIEDVQQTGVAVKAVPGLANLLFYSLLAIGWLALLLPAVLYFPVILLFGRDAPGTSLSTYLLELSYPALAVVVMTLCCWLAHRLWLAPRTRLLGFALACGLSGSGVWLAAHPWPH